MVCRRDFLGAGSAVATSLIGSGAGAGSFSNAAGNREGREKSSADFFWTTFHGTGTLLFDGGESLLAGEDGVIVQGVVGIVSVENVFVQAGHVVECGIEGEVVAEMVVEEELVEEEVVKEE